MAEFMIPGNYVIFTALGGGMCIGLDHSGLVLRSFDSSSNATTWTVHSIAGSRGYHLQHQATGFCAHFSDPIEVSTLNPGNTEFVQVSNDIAGGFVTISNHNETLVYAVYGASRQAGTSIIPDQWTAGQAQKKWRFIPAGALGVAT
jgi:hypothetical protein